MKILAILALAASTCTPNPTPPPTPTPVPVPTHVADAAPPKPVPPPSPPPPADSCASECLNLQVLKCPEWSATCVADCTRLDANKTKLGEKTSNHVCIANANSCAAAKACR